LNQRLTVFLTVLAFVDQKKINYCNAMELSLMMEWE